MSRRFGTAWMAIAAALATILAACSGAAPPEPTVTDRAPETREAESSERDDAERASDEAPTIAYVVRSDAALRELRVSVCFRGAPPTSLVPGIAGAGDALRSAHDGRGRALPMRDGRIDLRAVVDGGCARYVVDVDVAQQASRFSGRFGIDVMLSAGAWLWRDPRGAPPGGATLRFDLPDGLRAETPWPGAGELLVLDASAFQRPSFMALGRFSTIRFERASARVHLVALGEGWALDEAGRRAWLETMVDGVATVQGRFPVDRVLIVMVPRPGHGMGFGMVRRGGGASVAFEVGQDSTADELLGEWVGWHELSHLQLPALPQRDAWLYEGLATYYQEVLPARVGVTSPDEAWRQLVGGFARGERGGGGDRSLTDEAASMHRTRAYSHVYWSGTAFALEADVALRQRGSSLDEAIARGAQRWRGSNRVWTSAEVCAVWDRPMREPVLRPLRERYAARRGFPDVDELLRALGVHGTRRAIELRDATLGHVRAAIMGAPTR